MKTLRCWLLLPLVSSLHVWNYDEEGKMNHFNKIKKNLIDSKFQFPPHRPGSEGGLRGQHSVIFLKL